MTTARLFGTSERDVLVLAAGLGHALLVAVVLAFAATGSLGPGARVLLALCLAVAMNWGSNTVSHIHLHTPLFRGRAANAAFSVFLSVLLAVPQSWWKLRHLAHHGLSTAADRGEDRALRLGGAFELAALLVFVAALAAARPLVFATVYAPGMLLGFLLCANQGWQEHRRSSAGVDVHARLYNRLWFNDGFHAAHHRAPDAHWTTLPARTMAGDVVSAWPPLLRWFDGWPALANRLAATTIDRLERWTLALPFVRRFLLSTHAQAWSALLRDVPASTFREVTIIGGGLFPRTALVLSRLLPDARLTIVDASPRHLALARGFLAPLLRRRPDALVFVAGRFDPDQPPVAADLVVVPLAFRGDRSRFYAAPCAGHVAVHDWLWRRRQIAHSRRVSLLLLKRLNLVVGAPAAAGAPPRTVPRSAVSADSTSR